MTKNILKLLWSSGIAGAIMSLAIICAVWALWDLLWPYVALILLALMTVAFWIALDALWRFRHHMLEPKVIEMAGSVPQASLMRYQASVDDAIRKVQWDRAFKIAAQVAKYHGGSYSLHGLESHFECDNYRAVWEYMKDTMVNTGEVIKHKSRGMILLDYGRFIFRFNHGLLILPPAPVIDPPTVNVWSRESCKACMANQSQTSPNKPLQSVQGQQATL